VPNLKWSTYLGHDRLGKIGRVAVDLCETLERGDGHGNVSVLGVAGLFEDVEQVLLCDGCGDRTRVEHDLGHGHAVRVECAHCAFVTVDAGEEPEGLVRQLVGVVAVSGRAFYEEPFRKREARGEGGGGGGWCRAQQSSRQHRQHKPARCKGSDATWGMQHMGTEHAQMGVRAIFAIARSHSRTVKMTTAELQARCTALEGKLQQVCPAPPPGLFIVRLKINLHAMIQGKGGGQPGAEDAAGRAGAAAQGH